MKDVYPPPSSMPSMPSQSTNYFIGIIAYAKLQILVFAPVSCHIIGMPTTIHNVRNVEVGVCGNPYEVASSWPVRFNPFKNCCVQAAGANFSGTCCLSPSSDNIPKEGWTMHIGGIGGLGLNHGSGDRGVAPGLVLTGDAALGDSVTKDTARLRTGASLMVRMGDMETRLCAQSLGCPTDSAPSGLWGGSIAVLWMCTADLLRLICGEQSGGTPTLLTEVAGVMTHLVDRLDARRVITRQS